MNSLPVIKIALAENHTLVRNSLINLINSINGLEICMDASNGKELLHKISKAQQLPDICLIDTNMPVMDGFETMLQVKKTYPKIRGLALSELDTEYSVLRMLKNGASGYITKNEELDILEKTLFEIYTNGFSLSKNIAEKFPRLNEKNIGTFTKKLFSEKELLFLSLCCSEKTYREIAETMNLSNRTVENYGAKLCIRLQVHSRLGLALYALNAGIGNIGSAVELSRKLY